MNGFRIWDRLSEEDKKRLQEQLGIKEPVEPKTTKTDQPVKK